MKKVLLFIGSIALCLIIFIAMPYCLLKNSFSNDCETKTSSCSKTIEHKIKIINSISDSDLLHQDTIENSTEKSRNQIVLKFLQTDN